MSYFKLVQNHINFRQLTCYTYRNTVTKAGEAWQGKNPGEQWATDTGGALVGPSASCLVLRVTATWNSAAQMVKKGSRWAPRFGLCLSGRVRTGWAETRFVTCPNSISRSEPNPLLVPRQFKRNIINNCLFCSPRSKTFLTLGLGNYFSPAAASGISRHWGDACGTARALSPCTNATWRNAKKTNCK